MAYKITNNTGNSNYVGTYFFPVGESYHEKLPLEVVTILDEHNDFIDVENIESIPVPEVPVIETGSMESSLFDTIDQMEWKEGVAAVKECTDLTVLQGLAGVGRLPSVQRAATERLAELATAASAPTQTTTTETTVEANANGENNPNAAQESESQPTVNG